jgi:hypothetical protein
LSRGAIGFVQQELPKHSGGEIPQHYLLLKYISERLFIQGVKPNKVCSLKAVCSVTFYCSKR